MGYFTELIDRIWDEKGKPRLGGGTNYTWKQTLSIFVLVMFLAGICWAILGICYAGMGIWTLIKGFFAADG